MGKTLTIKKVAHHRNGVCGDPFDVGIIDDHMSEDDGESVYPQVTGEKLVIQFDTENLTGNDCMTAVLDLELLKQGKIEFMVNSWRGDHYHDEFKKQAKKMFDKMYA